MYHLWLLQNANCMDDTLQRQYLGYIWKRKAGVFYLSDFPPAEKKSLEDRNFFVWLSILECLSGFSLFPEFMREDALPHLLVEVDRLIHGEIAMTAPSLHYVRCAESRRDKHARNADVVLRIARVLVRC